MALHIVKQNPISGYSLQFVLSAYKTGAYVLNMARFQSSNLQNALGALERQFLIQKKPTNMPMSLILLPTKKTVEFVNAYFDSILTTFKICHLYPIIMPDRDKVEVLQDLTNTETREEDKGWGMLSVKQKMVRSHDLVPAGTYLVTKVQSRTIYLVAADRQSDQYAVNTYEARDLLKLQLPNPIDFEQERTKRFGNVKVKQLVHELEPFFKSNLEFAGFMSSLYENPALQGRLV